MQFSRICACTCSPTPHTCRPAARLPQLLNQDCGCVAADPQHKVRGSLWVGSGPSVGWYILLIIWYRAGRPGASLIGTVLLSLALATLAAIASLLVQVLTHLVAIQSRLVLGSRTAQNYPSLTGYQP